MGVLAAPGVDGNIQLTVHKFLVFHLRGCLGEKEISLLVFVCLLVLFLGE